MSGALLSSVIVKPISPAGFNTTSPSVAVDVVDADGKSLTNAVGELAIRTPFVGMTQSFWQDDERYLDTYWNTVPGIWVHGDLALRRDDGTWFMMGRSDDTIKLAGKRLGPGQGDDRQTAAAARRATQEVHGAADRADIDASGDFGVHLASEVDLDGGVDGGQLVDAGEHLGVMGIAGLAQLQARIAVRPAPQPFAAHQDAGDANAGIDALARVGQHAGFSQRRNAVADRATVQPQVAAVMQRRHHGLESALTTMPGAELLTLAIGTKSLTGSNVTGPSANHRVVRWGTPANSSV